MLNVIFEPRNRGVLFAGVTVALGLAVLSVFQVSRTARMGAYGGKEQSPPENPQAPVKLLAQNNEASFRKPEDSPYGMAKIAFNRDNAVYLYDAQTKESKRIGDGYDPDISPMGDAIAFTAYRDESETDTMIKLFRVHGNTTSEFQSLAKLNVRGSHWSHDGTKLAFDLIVDRRSHVGILDVSTGNGTT